MAPPALPAVGTATFLMPNSLAMEIARAMPRALKLPVGRRLSSFTYRFFVPNSDPRLLVSRIGVMVSVRDTILSGFEMGSISRYRQIVGGRPNKSFFVNFFLSASRSYLTQSGRWQDVQRLCAFPAS